MRAFVGEVALLAARASLSRLGFMATFATAFVVVTATTVTAWSERMRRSGDGDPLAASRAISRVLGQWYTPDVAARLEAMAPTVLIATLALMACLPLLGGVHASLIESRLEDRVGSFGRTAAGVLSTFASTLAVCVITLLAANVATLGGLVRGTTLATLMSAGCALIAALPYVAAGAVVRGRVRSRALGVLLGVSAVVALRYGLPPLARGAALPGWLLPRTAELWLLSSSPLRVASGATLAAAWMLFLFLLELAIVLACARVAPLRARTNLGSEGR